MTVNENWTDGQQFHAVDENTVAHQLNVNTAAIGNPNLTAIAALTTTTFGRSLLTVADAAAGRTTLGVGRVIYLDARDSGITFDGTTDDTTAWNTLSGTLVAGDTLVLPPKKTSIISAYINFVAADLKIIGNGSLLELAAGSVNGTTVMYLQGARSTVDGLYLDARGIAGTTGIRLTADAQVVKNCDMKDCIAGGIYFQGAVSGTKILNNNIHGNGFGILSADNSTPHDIIISGNTLDGSGAPTPRAGDGIEFNCPTGGAYNITITNNVVRNYDDGTGTYYGIGIGVAGGKRFVIANNIVSNTGDDGIHVEDDSTDFVISGNTVISAARSGISVQSATSGKVPTRFSITDNKIINCVNRYGNGGIALEGAVPVNGGSVIGNHVRGTGYSGGTCYGIYLGFGGSRIRCIGNSATNTNGTAALGIGWTNLTNSKIAFNDCYDDQVTKTQQYGINNAGICTDLQVVGNDLIGNGSAPIYEGSLSTASFDITKRFNRPNSVDSPQEFPTYAGNVTTDLQYRTAFGNNFPGVGFCYFDTTNNKLVFRIGTNSYVATSPDSVTSALTNKDLTSSTNTFPIAKPSAWQPADEGLIGWAFDPAVCSSGVIPGVAGLLYVTAIPIRAATTITNIVMEVFTAGATLTSGQNFAALFNAAGTLLSTTADQSTPWASTGRKTMALGTPQAVTPGIYYTGFWANATTRPKFLTAVASSYAVTLGGSPVRFGYDGTHTGLTTAAPATMASPTAFQNHFWAALS